MDTSHPVKLALLDDLRYSKKTINKETGQPLCATTTTRVFQSHVSLFSSFDHTPLSALAAVLFARTTTHTRAQQARQTDDKTPPQKAPDLSQGDASTAQPLSSLAQAASPSRRRYKTPHIPRCPAQRLAQTLVVTQKIQSHAHRSTDQSLQANVGAQERRRSQSLLRLPY